MNDVELIKKLNDINECKKQAIDYIKQNIGVINEIIFNSFNAGEYLSEQNNSNPFQMIPQKAILWNFLGDKKNVFFIKNNIWFSISSEASSIYLGFPPNTTKIESADDDIITEYIEFVLSNKNTISNRIDSQIESLKTSPEKINDFINYFQEKIGKSG
jgi:spore cortex formation protein SpoVR/YcgB (stage V sporulation)